MSIASGARNAMPASSAKQHFFAVPLATVTGVVTAHRLCKYMVCSMQVQVRCVVRLRHAFELADCRVGYLKHIRAAGMAATT